MAVPSTGKYPGLGETLIDLFQNQRQVALGKMAEREEQIPPFGRIDNVGEDSKPRIYPV